MNCDSLTTLHRISELAVENEPLYTLLTRALQILAEAPNFMRQPEASIFTVDRTTRTLRLEAQIGAETHVLPPGTSFPFDASPMGQVARTAETLLICRNSFPPPMRFHAPCQHAIALRADASPIAVLNLSLSEGTNTPLSTFQSELLGALAPMLGRIVRHHLNHRQQVRLAAIVHENPHPILECDTEGNILYTNPATRKIMWQHAIDATELIPENHIEYVQTCLANHAPLQVQNTVKNSTYSWSYIHANETDAVHLYGLDITEHRLIERQLTHDAMHDRLTGLPNRNYLLSLVKNSLTLIRRRPDYLFALLLIDIHNFKSIIESLGYPAAEAVLKETARRLSSWTARGNTLARLGGDEFALLIEDIGNASAAIEAAHIINGQINEPIQIDQHPTGIHISINIGIAIGDADIENAEALLQNASTAVYRCKREDSTGIEVFNKQMHLAAINRLQVQAELKKALQRNELRLYYQPVFSLVDLRLRGFEALVRWQHPSRGLIGPAHFIGIAEESGLIHELGRYVLETACRQLAHWQHAHPSLIWISVNVATQQFLVDTLVQDMRSIIETTQADPRRLFIEITEGTAAKNPERAFRMLSDLRDCGIRIALDDFGTGYSSMAYLKRFPIDALKLDRSFISGLPENTDDAAIATSVITMAKSLGMKIVAEGVEHERQAMFLRSMGCDEVQGFLYGHPMPKEQATQVLVHGRPAN
ncbi:MAG: EAL domain-containing protein [Myxococcales bacterium]|nr:EAL domain-containing protein [Myxococcales bacterium]